MKQPETWEDYVNNLTFGTITDATQSKMNLIIVIDRTNSVLEEAFRYLPPERVGELERLITEANVAMQQAARRMTAISKRCQKWNEEVSGSKILVAPLKKPRRLC